MKNQFIEVTVSRGGNDMITTVNKSKINSIAKNLEGKAVLLFGSEGSLATTENYESFIDRLGGVDRLGSDDINLG